MIAAQALVLRDMLLELGLTPAHADAVVALAQNPQVMDLLASVPLGEAPLLNEARVVAVAVLRALVPGWAEAERARVERPRRAYRRGTFLTYNDVAAVPCTHPRCKPLGVGAFGGDCPDCGEYVFRQGPSR